MNNTLAIIFGLTAFAYAVALLIFLLFIEPDTPCFRGLARSDWSSPL